MADTNTSIITLLYDLTLLVLLTRLAFLYFILSLASSLFLAYLSSTLPRPNPSPTDTIILTAFYALWARYIIVSSSIPRVLGFRLAIGFLAASFMLVASTTLKVLGGTTAAGSWKQHALGLLVLASMPNLMMVFESRDEVGCEKKRMVDDV